MRLADLRLATRYDGLLWRGMAYLGSAYGPAWWRRYSPPAFGALFYGLLGSRRRAVRENHRRIRPGCGPLDVEIATLGTFLAFARCLTDTLEAAGPRPPDFAVAATGEGYLEDVHRRGRGAVMVTAHVGNWELLGRFAARKGYPVTVAMARERNESVRGFVDALRAGTGLEVLYTDGTAFAALDLLRALRQNRILAVQIDRPAGGDGDHTVSLFDVPVAFPLGPFLLAQAAGAPVVPVFTYLVGHHSYRVEVSPPLDVARGGGRGAAEAVLGEVVRVLEDSIRRHPDQWFHFAEIGVGVRGSEPSTRSARLGRRDRRPTRSSPTRPDGARGTGSS